MSSKKRLDDIAEDDTDTTELVDVSTVRFPQYEGAKDELIRQEKIISEMTGEPVKGHFVSKKETVGGIRKKIRELPGYQTGKKTPKNNLGQQKPDRPKRKL